MDTPDSTQPSPSNDPTHWDTIYSKKGPSSVSWFESSPETSLSLIKEFASSSSSWSFLDVGGGASSLGPTLEVLPKSLDFVPPSKISVIDFSKSAITLSKEANPKSNIDWIVADVTQHSFSESYDVVHDRAVFHFMNTEALRDGYKKMLHSALKPGSIFIISTFDIGGPQKCSNLPIVQYSPESLGKELGKDFSLLKSFKFEHTTPWDSVQRFQFSVFRFQTQA